MVVTLTSNHQIVEYASFFVSQLIRLTFLRITKSHISSGLVHNVVVQLCTCVVLCHCRQFVVVGLLQPREGDNRST